MNSVDKQYLALCERILNEGMFREDRTGTNTIGVFGAHMRFDLSEGFPLLTTKRVPFRLVAEELLWFISGDTDLKTLLDKDVDIWTRDAYAKFKRDKGVDTPTIDEGLRHFRALAKSEGYDLGPIYGAQWRSWEDRRDWSRTTIDQLAQVIESIRENPTSRRHIMTTWNVAELDEMALPPCHGLVTQFYVSDGKLSCSMYQRSADVFLGLPFNIASYALLTHMIAAQTGLGVGELIMTLGDAHIYTNHVEQVREQLTREPKHLPSLWLNERVESIDDYTIDDIGLADYESHPAIKGKQSF